MLNAYPLNAVPLNGLAPSGAPAATVIEPGSSFAWAVTVTLGGADISDKLQTSIRVACPRDGDTVASFTLWMDDAPIDVGALAGQEVTVDFHVMGDPVVTARLFTGYLVQPVFDVFTRQLACEATTRLADTFESMELDQIDLQVGGYWSPDVFDEVAGRSRWEYAQERMSTRQAGLGVDRFGTPRITPWQPASISYEFADGSVIYGSVEVSLAVLTDTINTFELELDYRYSRYRQRNVSYSWTHPAGSFAAWRADSTELPDVEMIVQATESAGWFLRSANYTRLPTTNIELTPPWYNINTDLLLAAEWSAGIRWSQRAVEQYRLSFVVESAVASVGPVVDRDRIVLDTDSDREREWDGSRPTSPVLAGSGDPLESLPAREQARLDAALNTGMARAVATVLSAQRGNGVTWDVPLAHALGLDVGHGVRLINRSAVVSGSVEQLVDELNFETGAAIRSVEISTSRGAVGAVSDALAIPDAPEFVDEPMIPPTAAQPTQIGFRSTAPAYDEELPGFAGNYSVPDANENTLERYPRRFVVETPEIPASLRDEITAERAVTYRIAPPIDQLEL